MSTSAGTAALHDTDSKMVARLFNLVETSARLLRGCGLDAQAAGACGTSAAIVWYQDLDSVADFGLPRKRQFGFSDACVDGIVHIEFILRA